MKTENLLRVLFIGDIVGKPGRRAVKEFLAENKKNYDLVIANGENLASGHGIVMTKYEEMISAGIDYFTSGNHIWDKEEFAEKLDDKEIKVLRPENYTNRPGRGATEIDIAGQKLLLINLLGQVFIPEENIKSPFESARKIIENNPNSISIIDIHAEATSEKIALFRYLDGKVAAIIGTHTHVQTADEQISKNGTAYISDAGMTGPVNSILGAENEIILRQFLTGEKQSHKVATGDAILSAVEIDIDIVTKRATSIKRISKMYTTI